MEEKSNEACKVQAKTQAGTSLLDLNIDSLVQCVSTLHVQDLASLAMTCKRLRGAVYSDSIWELQCRKRWPMKRLSWGKFEYYGGRKAYLDRHVASQQFLFQDPVEEHLSQFGPRVNNILLEDDGLVVSQGSTITAWSLEPLTLAYSLNGHSAQITSMRMLPSIGLNVAPSGSKSGDALLVTSSLDHTVRVWEKGRLLRTFRGHSCPVTTLSSRLLGTQQGPLLVASGGTDGTIRLWALSSNQKRGQSRLQKTIHGHEHAIKKLSVAEYNSCLLISAAKDLKVRVWDVTPGSLTTGPGSLVGSARSPGVPVGLTCNGSLCFVAGGSSFMVVDLRSMKTVTTVAAHESGLTKFSIPVSGQLVCTGGVDRTAKLWDLRNASDPYAVLGDHFGPVNHVYMDSYKVVTGGPDDKHVYVWDAKTGAELNTLENLLDEGVTAMAVNGLRIATASCTGEQISLRDFSNCAVPLKQASPETTDVWASKFWEMDSQSSLRTADFSEDPKP